MLGELDVSSTTLSADQIDKLFDGVPDEVKTNTTPQNSSVKLSQEDTPIFNNSSTLDIPFVDVDKLEEIKEEVVEEKEEIVAEEKVEEKKVEEIKEEVKTPSEDEVKAINEVLKNGTNFLIEKGIFKDFDGREDMEIDSDTFAELLEKQVEAKVTELYNDKKSSTGEYGQAIIDHIEKGGDPDEIIDIFKEIKEVEAIELTDSDSQKSLITKWYKEQHGWSDAKISKYLNTLLSESDEALEGEAEEVKSKYDEHYKNQLEQVKERQIHHQKEQEKVKQQFETNITKAIEARKVDDRTKQLLKNSVLKFKKTDDGQLLNDLYIKFAEIQRTPELYAEFVEWAMDKEGYLKRQLTPIKNEIATKTFNFVKGNTAVSKTKGSSYNESPQKEKSNTLDFSSLFKK